MNQKRITNQILNQKNYTLNSTLNYLFNISNMKKLFSYLLISSMVVLSSCTNYDDQFDDLNTQINTLKSQIEGFSSLSSGLTALQGTVGSLQTAIAALPTTTTDISGLESGQSALTTALEALATRLTTLETNLADAATAAEVAALQTALTAAQSDLTELLASNNVYSDNLTINSQATLDVAKSLGGKLAIINGGVTIEQTSSMSAEDLQAVVDVMVTITGSVTYTMDVNGSTQAVFNNLTSVGGLTVDVSGAINFPELQNAGAILLEDTHKNYVTSVEFPKLSKVTSFATASSPNTISFSKATAVTLSELANYGTNSSLTISGKLDFALDLAKLTSKTAAGVRNPISLTINGAKEVNLPLFEEGSVKADSSEKVVLAKFKGGSGDSFAKAEYLHLDAYEKTFESTSTSLDTMIFGGVAPSSATTSASHPTLNLTGASSLTTLTVKGELYELDLNGNTSLTSVTVSGTINDVKVIGATSLEELVLGHTGSAATKDESDLTITGNTELASLNVDSIKTLGTLNISGNTSLETISFDALTGVGIATVPVVNITDNNLSASEINKTGDGTTAQSAAGGVGTITSDSGMKDLKAYLAAAAAKATTAGSSVYVSFDAVETYVDEDGDSSDPLTYTADTKGGVNVRLEVVNVVPADTVIKLPNQVAYIVNLTDADASSTVIIEGNGGTSLTYTKNDVAGVTTAETEEEFIDRIIADDDLSDYGVGLSKVSNVNRRHVIKFSGTTSTTAHVSYINLGSASYSSETATPTGSYADSRIKLTVGTADDTNPADAAAAYVTAFNTAASGIFETRQTSGTYTTSTSILQDHYLAVLNGNNVEIFKKKTVYDGLVTATGTLSDTVKDLRAASIPVFTLKSGNLSNTIALDFNETDTALIISDELYGTGNTPGLALAGNIANTASATIIVEDSQYSETTGARIAHEDTLLVPYSGALTRAAEFNNDEDADPASKRNIATWL